MIKFKTMILAVNGNSSKNLSSLSHAYNDLECIEFFKFPILESNQRMPRSIIRLWNDNDMYTKHQRSISAWDKHAKHVL